MRLQDVLGAPVMRRFRERLRKTLEAGRALPATVMIAAPSGEERAHLEGILGRAPGRPDVALRVDVAQVAAILAAARICDDLVEGLEYLEGPIRDRAGEALARREEWERLGADVRARAGGRTWLVAWYDALRADGVLARLSSNDPRAARALVETALRVLDGWPEAGTVLPELAARTVGDAHALDEGRPLGTLLVRAAAAYGGLDAWDGAEERRECWAAAGVLCDELSAPVLVLGLAGGSENLTDRMLRMYTDAGEACALTLRQIVRQPPRFEGLAGRAVYVCENPAIVAAAAERLGARCAPVVCTAGHLRGATRRLLRALAAAGVELRVRADFDPAGLQIASWTLELAGAVPWRLDASTYLAGPPGPPLTARTIPDTPWDPDLAEAMRERGCGVHEEAYLSSLLEDLRAD